MQFFINGEIYRNKLSSAYKFKIIIKLNKKTRKWYGVKMDFASCISTIRPKKFIQTFFQW